MKARPRLLDWAMTVLALDCDSAHSVRACRRAETAAMVQSYPNSEGAEPNAAPE